MRFVTLSAIIISMATISASAETAFWGVGAKTCGVFANYYKINPKLADDLYFSWAQGFLSGINYKSIVVNGDSRDLSSIDIEQQMTHVRKYCDERPLADFIDAVMDLYKDLPEIKKIQKK